MREEVGAVEARRGAVERMGDGGVVMRSVMVRGVVLVLFLCGYRAGATSRTSNFRGMVYIVVVAVARGGALMLTQIIKKRVV